MINSVTKPKLAKGFAYVLKTSHLAKMLLDAKIDCHIDLVYWRPRSGGSILEGFYWLPNENVSYPRVYVRAGIVTVVSYMAASEAMFESVLPQFISWLEEIIALPALSPLLHTKPYFNASYTDNSLVVVAHQP